MLRHVRLIRRLLPYARPYRWRAVTLIVLTALAAVLALFEPWPLALLVDGVLGTSPFPSALGFLEGHGPTFQILVAVLLGFALTLVTHSLAVATRAVDTRLELGMVLDFRRDLFEHIQRLSFQYHDRGMAGRFIYQVNYIAHDAGTVLTSLVPLAESVLTLFGMFWITYRLDPTLALVATAVVPVVSFATGLYGRHIEPQIVQVRELEGDSMAIVHEKLSMVRVVVSFCRERYETARFRQQAESAVDARVRLTILQTAFSLGVGVLTAAGTAAVLVVGAQAVLHEDLTVGQLLVVLSYVAAVYQPLQTITATMTGLQQQLIQLGIVFDVLDTRPEVEERPGALTLEAPRGRITFEHVSFRYEGRERTLDDISLDIAPGEFVAIVGPTGAGKSTLVGLAARFHDPYEGRILLDGHDLRDLTLHTVRGAIAMVMQEPVLAMGTIAENIRYGRLDATEAEIEAAARSANCHDFVSALPSGYGTVLGERGARLSGGERQRIAIARAFLKDAPILVLDEPTSAIDSGTEAVILDSLDRLARGRTTLLIAHRLSTIRRADRIVVVDQGRIVEQGTHNELLAADGQYARLWRTQLGEGDDAPSGDAGDDAPSGDAGEETAASVAPAAVPSTFAIRRRPVVVVLGMMTKMPVPGVVWQTVHYLVGLQRLGVDAYYVEAHARTPSMFMASEHDDGTAKAVAFLADVMARFGFRDRWAFHALHDDGSVHGCSEAELRRLYAEADLIVNLHGGSMPRPEHAATGRLVYLETDPVQLQIELHEQRQATIDFLEPHVAFFTFGENYGTARCGLPVSDRFFFRPTRQPVVLDFWDDSQRGPCFTTIGNWRQAWREVQFDGDTYHWSKHHEFLKILGLPQRTEQPFELALSGCTDDDVALLTAHGWRVVPASGLHDIDVYRRYVEGSRGELTVAKDQNVRFHTGWFSDRSATYLAAGRPVITQDTGFGDVLPTGSGLFAFSTLDDAVAAVEAVNGDYERYRRGARAVASDCFRHDVVLRPLLDAVGVQLPAAATPAPAPARATAPAPRQACPPDLDLSIVGRRPTTLSTATVDAVLTAQLPAWTDPVPCTAPTVSVVVVVHDGLVFTRLGLESLLVNTVRPDVEVIVVDNASTDGTTAYLDALSAAHPRVRLLHNGANVGFPAAVNQGLAAARGEVLVLLNNDTIVAPGWIEGLERHLRDERVGLVGPVTNGAPNEARIAITYTTYGEFLRFAEERSQRFAGRSFDLPVATMFCVAMRRATFERVGPLDEGFGLGMFEDDDYSMRVRACGLAVRCAEDVVVHHFGEASFGALVAPGGRDDLLRRNRARFEQKWGVTWTGHSPRADGDYASVVVGVRAAIADLVPDDVVVLVVSRGDDDLLDVPGRDVRHFPQGDDGEWAGWYPATTGDVLAHLDDLRERGAGALVVPSTARWWFDFYEGLEAALGHQLDEVGTDGSCRVYLARRPAVVGTAR